MTSFDVAHLMNSHETSFCLAPAGIWSPCTATWGKRPAGPPGGSAKPTRSLTLLLAGSAASPTHASASM